MNIIKNMEPGENPPESINVFISAKRGDRNYYQPTNKGFIKLVHCLDANFALPKDFGVIPQTYYSNMQPLQAFVIARDAPEVGSLVSVKPVGTIKYNMEGITHENVLGVVEEDEIYSKIDDIEDLNDKHTEEISQFLKEKGHIKNKNIKIKGWFGKEKAEKLINSSLRLYKRKIEE